MSTQLMTFTPAPSLQQAETPQQEGQQLATALESSARSHPYKTIVQEKTAILKF